MADTFTKTPPRIGYFDDPARDLPPKATGGELHGPDARLIYYDNPPAFQGVAPIVVAGEAVLLVILLHGLYRKLPSLIACLWQ